MTSIRTRTLAVTVLFSAAATLPFAAQDSIDLDLNARIRDEGINRSQVMRTLHFLADVYGPRVTGSPSLKAAGEWAVKTMEGWGMKNGHLEPWSFGHPGWVNELAWGAITAPVKDTLVLEVLAWTPGTMGTVKGTAINIVIPEQPTPEELSAYFASLKSRVKGAVVLVGRPRAVPVNITPPAKQRVDEEVKASTIRPIRATGEDAAASEEADAVSRSRGRAPFRPASWPGGSTSFSSRAARSCG